MKQTSPAAEALLWAKLSQLFGGEDMTWDEAQILGLISPNYCQHTDLKTLKTLLEDLPAPSGHDENGICHWGWMHNTIIGGGVIPLLESSQ
jgi:hypothetical protein